MVASRLLRLARRVALCRVGRGIRGPSGILGRPLAQVGYERLNAAQPEQDDQDHRRVFHAPSGIEGRDVREGVRGQTDRDRRQTQEHPFSGAKTLDRGPVLRDE